MEKSIDARFAQVHETMANNLQVLLAAIEARSSRPSSIQRNARVAH